MIIIHQQFVVTCYLIKVTLFCRLKEVSEWIGKRGFCSPIALHALRNVCVQDVVVGHSHIALLLQVSGLHLLSRLLTVWLILHILAVMSPFLLKLSLINIYNKKITIFVKIIEASIV